MGTGEGILVDRLSQLRHDGFREQLPPVERRTVHLTEGPQDGSMVHPPGVVREKAVQLGRPYQPPTDRPPRVGYYLPGVERLDHLDVVEQKQVPVRRPRSLKLPSVVVAPRRGDQRD